ncbi:MAG: photosystem I reaction center subunit PsaK [Cyanobacteria bacterium Co-bin8]|nr:photosystem I reaction center subunit PsaK [Cyanobacteria bacterium Co-bin8]
MMNTFLLAAATIPNTVNWSPKIAIIMIVANVLAIAIGKYTMKNPNAGPALPSSEFFGGMGWPALLATTSFGHILGFGTILGLANAGVL